MADCFTNHIGQGEYHEPVVGGLVCIGDVETQICFSACYPDEHQACASLGGVMVVNPISGIYYCGAPDPEVSGRVVRCGGGGGR